MLSVRAGAAQEPPAVHRPERCHRRVRAEAQGGERGACSSRGEAGSLGLITYYVLGSWGSSLEPSLESSLGSRTPGLQGPRGSGLAGAAPGLQSFLLPSAVTASFMRGRSPSAGRCPARALTIGLRLSGFAGWKALRECRPAPDGSVQGHCVRDC